GLLLLRDAQGSGEAEAYLLEGLWLLEGRFAERDLAQAREAIGRAAELGHVGAARMFAGMIACGIGAAPALASALALLESWSGSDPRAARQLELIRQMAIDDSGSPETAFAGREISADPRIQRVDGLFTEDECAFLAELSDPRMRRATIFH